MTHAVNRLTEQDVLDKPVAVGTHDQEVDRIGFKLIDQLRGSVGSVK